MKDQHEIPVVITPETDSPAARLAELADMCDPEWIGELLPRARAVLFRDFGVATDGLAAIMDLLLPGRLAYVHGNSPRTKVGQQLYTSTEYPPELTISLHNEMSYAHHWPARLLFYCQQPATAGGATPIADSAAWLDALDPEVREAFAGGVRYVQNLHGGKGLGKSWQATFETEDRAVVEAFLHGSGADWKWRKDGGLHLSQVRPATARHPVTGAEVWFNQADQWCVAGLEDGTATALARILPEEELPQSACFADGAPIPAGYVRHIRERGMALAVDVRWRAGDLLLIDNMLLAHGRRPFTGPRRILVAMSD
ncbi:MAG TPA: TauD/TfdA family dioxygenase [Rugosimonospora sp.]|nr:TauD/TfdA family dioxygenase [Rugosimonospora sp.]